jgi:Ca2+-binding RTX toxin-like protein
MLSAARSRSHRRASLLASLATLAAIATFAATSTTDAGTRAGVTCRFDIATHRLTVTFHNDDANGGIVRDGDHLVVEDVFGPLGCAGTQDPTRFNTERVRVRGRAQSVDDLEFKLDLREGPMAPGLGDEGDGSSEIEFAVSFPAGSASRVPIHGRQVPDRIVLGDLAHRRGANLNALEYVDDSDVTIRGGTFLVYGFGGADVVSARGGGGFIGPYPGSLFAFGQRGRDLLTGGPKRDYLWGMGGDDLLTAGRKGDYLKGGQGHDAMKGGRGGDFVHARDNTRDKVRCGRGSDNANADRIDRLRRCEDVHTKASG